MNRFSQIGFFTSSKCRKPIKDVADHGHLIQDASNGCKGEPITKHPSVITSPQEFMQPS